MEITYDTCPPCPGCGRKPFRKGHLVRFEAEDDGDGALTVCMYCGAASMLDGGPLTFFWREPTEAEWKDIAEVVEATRASFARNRPPDSLQ